MKTTLSIAAMLTLAGLAAAEPMTTTAAPEGVSEAQHKHAYRMIQMQTFYSLPEEHRAEIIEAAEEQGIDLPMSAEELEPSTDPSVIERSKPLAEGEADELYAKVSEYVDRETFDGFAPIHQRMLAGFVEVAPTLEAPVMPCFAPGTDPDLIMAFENTFFGLNPMAFQQTSRWGSTALNPGGSAAQGTPTILTYSFPADGVSIPGSNGEPTSPNQLNSWLDGIYGNRATWRAIYDDVFAQWGSLSGNTYVLEPNDDGANFPNSPGQAGVRGDLRMAAHPIDGNSNVLAYNFFPQTGDMVLDSADNFYNTTTQNSIRLRNILSHEHGHGMGQLHVCPIVANAYMLMNPFINTTFFGPQFDDTLNAQRHYGDPLEPNDSTGAATLVGSLGVGDTANIGGTIQNSQGNVDWVSVDDENDSDFYAFTLTQNGLLTATATPLGFEYLEGPQTQACDSGTAYNPIGFGNLRVRLYNSGGTLIATADDTGLGSAETLVGNLTAGTYYVEVDTTNVTNDQIQAYVLDLDVGTPVAQPLSLSAGVTPTFIPPGLPGFFDVTITLNDDTITDGPDLVITNLSGTTSVPLTDNGGGSYLAQIPAQDCGDDPEYFVTVTGTIAGTVNTGTFSTLIGTSTVVGSDSGNNVIGITVGGTIATQGAGQWTAGAPEGNDRDDPAADFDGNGLCWLTGRTPGNTNSDVDGGFTTIETIDYDFSGGGYINFAYWAADSVNTLDEATDGLFFEFSTNGGSSWSVLRDYDTANQWFTDSVSADEVGLAASVRFRWRAQEAGAGDVLECAVDAIEIGLVECDGGPTCDNPADTNGDGLITPADFNAWVVAFNAQAPECDQNADGLCTPADFNAWVVNFNLGCP